MTGYAHSVYAESFAEFGVPRKLERSDGWVLEREIPGFDCRDAMGCYPLFVCGNWSLLKNDLDDMADDLISLSLVTDPFGECDPAVLSEWFDIAKPFKAHFVVDLNQPFERSVTKHHRYYAQKALRNVRVELCANPVEFLDDWMGLYQTLIERHGLRGIKAFSRKAFERQLGLPGTVVLTAHSADTVVGAHLWYIQNDIAYSHLAAFSPLGYELMASYALYWRALEHFSGIVRWLDLGGGAGIDTDSSDGLTRFKKGWATGIRTVYFCGKVFNRSRYNEITKKKDVPDTGYFPAYRYGEFGS